MSAADWKPYDVPGLAGLLAEQPIDSGTHAMAWQQAYETLTDQRQRLAAARTALTEAWPATPGSAAGSFFDQVDALTQAMSATADTAVNAHGALTGIVTAVDSATAKVDTLHQSWQQNQATIGGVVPADDWTEPLNNQAHVVMGQADAAIAEHATQLMPPVPYEPVGFIEPYSPLSGSTGRPVNPHTLGPTSGPNGATNSSTDMRGVNSTSPIRGGRAGVSPDAVHHESIVLTSNVQSGAPAIRTARIAETISAQSSSRVGPIANSQPEALTNPLSTASGLLVPGPGKGRGISGGSAGDQTRHDSPGASETAAADEITGLGGKTIVGHLPASRSVESFGSRSPAEDRIAGSAQADSGSTVTDGSNSRPLSSTSQSAGRGPVETGNEYMPIGGLLPSASQASRARQSDWRRVDRTDVSSWFMPTGVPAILEATADVPVNHDPGTGVIGIDL